MKDFKEILLSKGIIAFDYQELDTDLIKTYKYFEQKFKEL